MFCVLFVYPFVASYIRDTYVQFVREFVVGPGGARGPARRRAGAAGPRGRTVDRRAATRAERDHLRGRVGSGPRRALGVSLRRSAGR